MTARRNLFASLLVVFALCVGALIFGRCAHTAHAAEIQEHGEELDKQIEYMLESARQVRDRLLKLDTTPPEILGLSELVVKLGEKVSYKRGVSVEDNSGVKLQLVIDNSQVDLSKVGAYTVYYSATDLSGNTTTVEVLLTVIETDPVDPSEVNAMADALMAEILTEDMDLQDKVYALWKWCKSKIKYSYADGARTVYEAAYEGFSNRSGDCYIYCACMEVFLDRLGVENMRVARCGGASNHWWNLVNLGDGWYHLDASPRRKGDTYKCFLQTDEQIAQYSLYYEAVNPGHPNYYGFDGSLYPERATEIIFDGGMNPMPEEVE